MAPRKRGRAEMKASESVQLPSLLARLRNTWEFANIMQYIYIFGKVVKIDDDFDIEARTSSVLSLPPSAPQMSQHKIAILTGLLFRTLRTRASNLNIPRSLLRLVSAYSSLSRRTEA